MSSDINSPDPLAAIREEIDLIDDRLLALLEQRFAVTEKVRKAKASTSHLWPLPLRPAREAAILRRLMAKAKGGPLNPDLLVRLWRAIISQSSINQAPMTIHVSRHLNANLGHRLRLRDYFGPIQVEEYRDEAQALLQIDAQPSDICVVETDQPWTEAFVAGKAGRAKVIAAIPVVKEEGPPRMLILGEAPSVSEGPHETLVISSGKLPRAFAPTPLWQIKSGPLRLTALPGFLAEHEIPLVGLMRSNAALGLVLAGHYSSAIEI